MSLLIGDVVIALPNDRQNYNRYLTDVSKYQLLSVDEEIDYFKKYRAGEIKYYDKIAQRNLRFVISVAKKYQNVVAFTTALTLEDLISEGNLGLCVAIQRYDETRGFKFISFAVHYIRSYINTCVYTHLRTIRMPESRQNLLFKLNKLENELQQEYQINEIPNEILQQFALERNIELASLIIETKNNSAFEKSLDSTMQNQGAGDAELTLKDTIEDDSFESPINLILDKEKADYLYTILDKIPSREANFLRCYYGLNDIEPMHVNEIARKYNIGKETVRFQIKRWTYRMNRYYATEYKEYTN